MISERYHSDPVYRAYVDKIAAQRPEWPESDLEYLRNLIRAGRREAAAEAARAAAVTECVTDASEAGGGSGPASAGCAARDSNPEPAD